MSLTRVDLPDPDTPVTDTRQPRGMSTSMSQRLCSRAPTTLSQPCWRWAAALRQRDAAGPRQVLAGDRSGQLEQLLDRTGVHHLAAVLPCPGADVDHVVGHHDRVLVVLDHQHRVAEVAEPHERLDELVVVALVEPDGRLVEHVEHPDQPRADLGCQPDALGLATRQGRRRALEGEVVEADVAEEGESGVDLLQHSFGDHGLAVVEVEVGQAIAGVGDGQAAQLVHVQPVDGDRQRKRVESCPLAGGARHLRACSPRSPRGPSRSRTRSGAASGRGPPPRTWLCRCGRGRSGSGSAR